MPPPPFLLQAHQFWLKQALDLILSILQEGERVMLAPNSSQVAPLINGTKQNVYNPDLAQQAAAAAQAAAAQQQAAAAQAGAAAAGQQPAAPAEGGVVVKQEGDVKPEDAMQAGTSTLYPASYVLP